MLQASLFGAQHNGSAPVWTGELPPGLVLVRDFVSAADESRLLSKVENPRIQPWSAELRRRVKHFGFRYDYKARALSNTDRLGPIPGWAQDIAHRLVEYGYFNTLPDQLIV